MISRRTLLMITSILVAAMGTALIGLYVRGVDSRAEERLKGVPVLMATRTVPRGMLMSEAWKQGAISRRTMAAQYAAGALPIEALDQNMDHFLTHTVFADTVIRTDMLGRSLVRHQDLTKGMGITVQLQDPNRAVGMLAPGDEVTIFVTRTGAESGPVVESVLKRVKVVSIGARKLSSPSATATPGRNASVTEEVPWAIVGLNVTSKQVIAIRRAEALGELSFGVIAPKPSTTPTTPTTPSNGTHAPPSSADPGTTRSMRSTAAP